MEPPESNIDIISVHIPKTAGTMFRKILVNAYGKERVFDDYKKEKIGKILPEINSQQIQAIHGHFKVQKYDRHFPEAKRIVWIRDPIKRFISNYWHQVTYFQKRKVLLNEVELEKEKFLIYAKKPKFRNLMSRHFRKKKLEDFGFVGITEFFKEDLIEIQKLLGWQEIKIRKVNKHRYPKVYSAFVSSVLSDTEMIEQLTELNLKDIKLYDRALKLRQQRKKIDDI